MGFEKEKQYSNRFSARSFRQKLCECFGFFESMRTANRASDRRSRCIGQKRDAGARLIVSERRWQARLIIIYAD